MRDFFRRKRDDGTESPVLWTNFGGKRVSTGCTDLRAAQAWKRNEERVRADPRLAAAQGARLEDCIRDFYGELRRRGRADATVEKNKKKLGHYPRLWGMDLAMSAIDARLVGKYIDDRLKERGIRKGSTVSRLTIRDELTALRQVLILARRNGLFQAHPDDVLPIVFETKHQPKKDWVREEDMTKLLSHVEPRHAAHILFFVCTGGRYSDSYRSQKCDWTLAPKGKETVLVRGSKTSGSWRTNPITPFLLPWVKRMLRDAEPYTAKDGVAYLFADWPNMNRDVKAACERAGIPGVSTNGLRRCFGKWHRLKGYDLDSISKLFGHTTARLARDVYADMDGEELRTAMSSSKRKKT